MKPRILMYKGKWRIARRNGYDQDLLNKAIIWCGIMNLFVGKEYKR